MKERKYPKKDGSEGKAYSLEDKETVRVLYGQARPMGNFGKFSIQVTTDLDSELKDIKEETKRYLELSKSQGEQLNKLALRAGDKIKGEEYKNTYGKFIGVRKA